MKRAGLGHFAHGYIGNVFLTNKWPRRFMRLEMNCFSNVCNPEAETLEEHSAQAALQNCHGRTLVHVGEN